MKTGIVALFALASFLAAVLLFSVQPMIGKMLLPVFGGTPAVWNTCLVFFQGTLLCGYLISHGVGGTRWTAGRQVSVFYLLGIVALLALAYRMLPIALETDTDWHFSSDANPAFVLLGALWGSATLPLVMVSATAPLVQCWFALTGHPRAGDPYFLYAASNAGSLLALVAYPTVIEPNWGLTAQSQLWRTGFLILAILVITCGLVTWRMGRSRDFEYSADDFGAGTGKASGRRKAGPAASLTLGVWLRWLVLVFVPSSWLLGVTTYLTTDLASIPLFWTIPLALYLLSFILSFARSGAMVRAARLSLPYIILPLVLVMSAGFVHPVWIPLHLIAFFAGSLACHGALAQARPTARFLSMFYVTIALGGLLGGIWSALAAPLLFDRVVEYPLVLVLVGFSVLNGIAQIRDGSRRAGTGEPLPAVARTEPRPPGIAEGRLGRTTRWMEMNWREGLKDLLFAAVVFAVIAALATNRAGLAESLVGVLGTMLAAGLGILSCVTAHRRPVRFALVVASILGASVLAPGPSGRLLHIERDFFGVVRVTHDRVHNVNRLFHGSTLHGQQSLDPALCRAPSTYFTRSGPIGQLLEAIHPRLNQPGAQVAIVGLGAGTLASYAQPGQHWTFYEIDAAIERIARDQRYFTYLRNSQADVIDVILGDARQRLQGAADRLYQLIVLDAFSSDAVPVHLLSREAIQLYRTKLASGGLLLFNLSNRYLDLDPVLGRQADDAGLICRIRYDLHVSDDEKQAGKQPSIWAVMAASARDLGKLADDPRWQLPVAQQGSSVWTDDYSDLASHLFVTPRGYWCRDR
jgi:hypothetical protein